MKDRFVWGKVCAATALSMFVGCTPAPAPDDGNGGGDDGPVSFADDIQPLLTSQCIICHQPGGIAFSDGITQDLRTGNAYDAIVNQPSDQDATLTLVVPGDAENSLLYQKVSSNEPPVGVRMPQFQPPLSAVQIDMIRRWIEEGAENN